MKRIKRLEVVFCVFLFVFVFVFVFRGFIRAKYPCGKLEKEQEVTVYHRKAELIPLEFPLELPMEPF